MSVNRLPSIGQDSDNWGSLLNGYLRVSLDETGGLNIVDVIYADNYQNFINKHPGEISQNDLLLNRKDGKIYRYKNAWQEFKPDINFTAVNKNTGSIFRWEGQNWNVISANGILNVKDWGARGKYEPYKGQGIDDSEAIQAALNSSGTCGNHNIGKVIYFPSARYLITKTLNLTTDLKQNQHCHLTIRGEGKERTNFYGATGGVLFDCTGSGHLSFEDFSIYGVNVPNPSTVGFLIARGKENSWAIYYALTRINVYFISNIQANKGIGTVGIWNYGGEHHTYTDIEINANLPVVLTRFQNPENLPGSISSPYLEVQPDSSGSQLFTSFLGTCVLVALDYYRPCLYLNRVAQVQLLNTYMGVKSSSPQSAKGNYLYAVEAHEVYHYLHYGMLEGPGLANNQSKAGYGYLKNNITLESADIKVLLTPVLPVVNDGKNDLVVPAIDTTPSNLSWKSGIYTSSIEIRYPDQLAVYPETTVILNKDLGSSTTFNLRNTKITSTNANADGKLLSSNILPKSQNVEIYDYRSNVKNLIGMNEPNSSAQIAGSEVRQNPLRLDGLPVAENDSEASKKYGLSTGDIYRTSTGLLRVKL